MTRMKKRFFSKERTVYRTSALLVFILSLSTCDFFSPGLGESVDIDPPLVTVLSHQNGSYVGGLLRLSGVIEDDIGGKSVVIDDGTTAITVIPEGRDWTAEIDTTIYDDGDHEFVITGTDLSEKASTVKLLLNIDNNPPTVMITQPALYGADQRFNQYVSIKGEAADTTRVKEVRVSIYLASTGEQVLDRVPATGTSSWYYLFDSTGAPVDNAEYYIEVVAEDYSGNRNGYFYHFRDIVDAVSDPTQTPSIEEINASDYQGDPLSPALFLDLDGDGSSADTLEDLRHTTAPGRRVSTTLDQSSDAPVFTFISPSYTDKDADGVITDGDTGDASENVLSLTQLITGFVEDDDGVDNGSIRMGIWYAATANPDQDPSDTGGADPDATAGWVSPSVSGNQWKLNTNLGTGEYYFRLYVEDIYGISNVSPYASFSVAASAPPNVTIVSPAQGSYIGAGGTLTILANVTNLGGGTVYLDTDEDGLFDDVAGSPPGALQMTDTGGGQFSSGILTEGVDFTAADGPRYFSVRAGASGSYGTGTLQLTGDISAPTAGLTYPGEGFAVNGQIRISGTAGDENQIGHVYFKIVEGTEVPLAAPPADWTGWLVPSGTDLYNWIYDLDTTALNDGASYTLHYFSVDGAGNISSPGAGHFSVSQNSDIPVFELSNLTEGVSMDAGPTGSNGLGQDASIIGIVEDDDLILVNTLEIRIDINDDGAYTGVDLDGDGNTLDANETEQWIPVSNKPATNSRIVSWSHNLINLSQGIHSMELRVQDSNGTWGTVVPTDFIIDYGPPTLIISAPANGAVRRSGFSITGTADDPNGIEALEISFDGGSTYQDVSLVSGSYGDISLLWFHPVTVDTVDGGDGYTTDGDYSYQVRATDSGGGKTTVDRQFVIDAEPPQISIDSPSGVDPVNGSVTVQGLASDNRLVQTIYYSIQRDPAAPVFPGDYTVVVGPTSWSFSFDTVARNIGDGNLGASEGYTVYLRAVDAAGNESLVYSRGLTVNQETDRPVIGLNEIDKDETDAAANVLVGAVYLTGVIEDDDRVDASTIEVLVDINDDGVFSGVDLDGDGNTTDVNESEAWAAVSLPPGADGKIVVWRHDISNLPEGVHSLKVRVRDDQSDGTWSGTSLDLSSSQNYNWNIEDGADQGGIPFIMNRGAPAITVDTPAGGSFHNSDVLVSGSAVDANGVRTVEISFDNGQTYETVYSTATPSSPVSWSKPYTVTGSNDGSVSYTIRARDGYDLTSIEYGQFTVDATPPGAAIVLPMEGSVVNGDISYSGTVSDNITISQVYVYQGTDAPADPAGGDPSADPLYSPIGPNYAWNVGLDTTGVNNSDTPVNYYFAVVSEDAAGNVSARKDRMVVINQDTDRPVISLASVTSGGDYTDNLLPSARQVSGTITDDDGVDVSTIQYRLFKEDGTTLLRDWTAVTGPPSTDTTLAAWTLVFSQVMDVDDSDGDGNVSELVSITDGRYQFQIRAADTNDAGAFTAGGFGWDVSPAVKIAIDTQLPVTGFGSSNGGYTNSNITVSGTATDAGGVALVEISYNGGAFSDLGVTPAASVGWSDTYVIDTAGHTDDGVFTYTVRLTDTYGKVNTYDRYVNVDTRDPLISGLVLVNNDAGTPATVNGSVLIQGIPGDNETLVTAIYAITSQDSPGEPGADPAAEGWTLLGSTSSISYRFNSEDLTPGAYTTYLMVKDAAGNRTPFDAYTLAYTVNQAGNNPVITINTPDGSVLSSTQTISGTVEDDDGVNRDTIEISTDGGTTWGPVTSASANGPLVSFSHSLTALSEGSAAYTVLVRASDAGESFADASQDVAAVETVSPSFDIFIDDTNPVASVTGLDNGLFSTGTLTGAYINDGFVISGTAEDGVQVAAVRARLAGEDFNGVNGSTVPTVTDENGDGDAATPFDTWTWTRTGLSLSGSSTLFYLEVEDVHGKITPYSYTLLVDVSAPEAAISTPSLNTGTSTGAYNGVQIFRGTSTDNVQVHKVYYRLSSSALPATADPVADGWTETLSTYGWNFTFDTADDPVFGNPTASNTTLYLGVVAVDSAGNVSPTAQRSFILNQGSDKPVIDFTSITEGGSYGVNELPVAQKLSGNIEDDDGVDASTVQFRLYDDDAATPNLLIDWTSVSAPPGADATFGSWSHIFDPLLADGKYQIQIRAADINDAGAFDGSFDWTESGLEKITVDSLSPAGTIDALAVTSPYDATTETPRPVVSGMLVNNSFGLTGTASDGNGVASVKISVDGGAFGPVDSFTEPAWTHTVGVARGGLSDGDLPIIIRITDTVGKITDKTLTVTVDTVEPATVLNYSSEMVLQAGVPTIAGPLAKVIGKVEDTGTISNVDRVDLFFVKGTEFYSPRTGAAVATGGALLPPESYIVSVDNRFEIDDDSVLPGDGDGFLEGLRSKGTYDEWYAYVNSFLLPDGPLFLHRAGYDGSGNRNIASSAIQISNYPPSIPDISIWGNVYAADPIRVKLDNSGEIIINATDHAEAPSGIDTGTYELEVIEQYNRNGGEVGTLNASYDAANTYLYIPNATGAYTLDTSGFTDDYYYRVQARVRDISGNVVTRDFYMWVYDSTGDSSAPTLEIHELTQANVSGSGHIEEAVNSPDGDSQADISGTIVFSGTVYDDNTNPAVTLEISYDGTTWIPLAGTAALGNETGSAQDGYTYDWSYSWDSSDVTGTAVNALQIRTHGTDGGNNDGYSPALTVDVVPYITDIITGLEIGLKSHVKRSALGRYTAAAGSTVTIKGYNLAGTAAGSVDVGGDDPVILSGDKVQQVIVLGSASGGDVTVTTNGISSRNNINTNTLPQNQEAADYYPDRNDDRVIALWQLANTGWSGEDAVMRPVIDTVVPNNRNGMEWMYVTTNDTLWLGGDKMTTSFTLSGGDFGYNSSGTRLWSFLHDAKWWITETNASNQQYFGSVQWSMQNGYTYTAERDEAYNWNIAAQTGRLGLGNMVYQSGTTGQIDRYENIQMKLVGNNSVTANYVTYYDKNSLERGITFVSFQTGTGVAASQYALGNYGGADWYSTIERVNPYDKAYAPTGNEAQKGTGINNPEYAGTATTARHKVVPGADAGADYVMAVDTAGTVYLAWYDPDTDTTGGDGFDGAGIKFMYNTNPVGNPLGGWTDPVTVASNAADTAYSHLALAVDPDGGIHLAYQDDDKGFLYYTYAASRTAVGTVMNTLLLDALFSSGQYNSLVIKDFDPTGGTDYRPVITTFSSAFTGTKQSLRVLYPAGAAGTVSMAAVAAGADIYGDFSGVWESIAVPASTAPKSVRTFTETDGAIVGQGRIIVGYNGLYMEEAVLLDLP